MTPKHRAMVAVEAKISVSKDTQGGRLQANEILLLPVDGAILVDELIDLVGIHLVRRDRIVVVVVTRHVIVISALALAVRQFAGSGARFAEDACPLSVGKLTAFVVTNAGVAEIGAFKAVTVKAADALVAVSIEAEITADGGTCRQYTVSIRAIGLGAVATFKMNTMRRALGGKLVR